MFQELVALVAACDKVVLTLTMKGDAMAVVVAPVVSKAADAALATPLALTASPAELDEGFAQAIASVSVSRRSLAEQVEATASILSAATSAQSTKAQKALSKANGKPAASSSDDADGADGKDDNEEGEGKAAAPAPQTSSPEPSGTNLADLL
ncbi:PRTRC system protein E [Cupriavidus necator]|uniref:PRTRC system protein E n=1 Tax=Cupriavidus necator TaxID=106590 RepID=UPI003ECCFD8F